MTDKSMTVAKCGVTMPFTATQLAEGGRVTVTMTPERARRLARRWLIVSLTGLAARITVELAGISDWGLATGMMWFSLVLSAHYSGRARGLSARPVRAASDG